MYPWPDFDNEDIRKQRRSSILWSTNHCCGCYASPKLAALKTCKCHVFHPDRRFCEISAHHDWVLLRGRHRSHISSSPGWMLHETDNEIDRPLLLVLVTCTRRIKTGGLVTFLTYECVGIGGCTNAQRTWIISVTPSEPVSIDAEPS